MLRALVRNGLDLEYLSPMMGIPASKTKNCDLSSSPLYDRWTPPLSRLHLLSNEFFSVLNTV